MSLVPSSLLFLVTVLDGFDDEWAIRLKWFSANYEK